MKIIIVGAGVAGTLLIQKLSEEGHDIVLIDKSEEIINEMTDRYSITGVVGSGASLGTLEKAGVATADMLVALTAVDEVNLLCCFQAKKIGTRKTVARLLLPDLVKEQEKLKEQYSIDFIVCPRVDMADLIALNAGLPGSVKLEGFFENEIQILSVYIDDKSPMVDRALKDIKREANINFLVAGVVRKGKLTIPDGNFKVEAGDNLYVVTETHSLSKALEAVGVCRSEGKKTLVVGGGIVCEYLTEKFLKEGKKVSILENNIGRCRKLSERFPNVNVSYGDGESLDVLEEECLEKMDVVISLTDKDETNLVICLLAWAKGVHSIITRVDYPDHAKLLHQVNMDITVSTAEVTINNIMQFVRNHEVGDAKNEIRRFYSICDGMAEIMEFNVTSSCRKLGVEFSDESFRLKKESLIAAIIRDNTVIVPKGFSSLCEGDKVIIVSGKKNHLLSLNDVFC